MNTLPSVKLTVEWSGENTTSRIIRPGITYEIYIKTPPSSKKRHYGIRAITDDNKNLELSGDGIAKLSKLPRGHSIHTHNFNSD